MKYKAILLLTIFAAITFFANQSLAAKNTFVRVAILRDAADFDLVVSDFYQIVDTNNKILSKGRNLKTKVIMAPEGLYFSSINLKSDILTIKPRNPDSIRINGRRFRGDVMMVGKKSGILAINYLNLEDYIKGVLYHEISHYWPIEAIKAQAVVSRTFALHQTIMNKNKEYDLTCDIYSQVYGGRTSERWRTSKAVDKTRGQIIKYKGKVFPSFFHATCGGQTEDVSNVWDMGLAPLKGVTCGYCRRSPHFNWHAEVSFESIRTSLNKSGYKINKIKGIQIKERNKTNRVSKLEIITDTASIDIPGKDFRNIIGPNLLRSLNFELENEDKEVVFRGIGWGHGVGMCQWGAYFMAKKGKKYDEIIKYFYPGVVLGYDN